MGNEKEVKRILNKLSWVDPGLDGFCASATGKDNSVLRIYLDHWLRKSNVSLDDFDIDNLKMEEILIFISFILKIFKPINYLFDSSEIFFRTTSTHNFIFIEFDLSGNIIGIVNTSYPIVEPYIKNHYEKILIDAYNNNEGSTIDLKDN